MSSSDNLELAKQYLSRLSSGAESEELESFFTTDVVQEEFPNRLLPHGAVRDRHAMKEARARGKALLESETYEIVNAIAAGDRVGMEVIWTATVKVPAGPFSAGQQL